VTLAADAVGYGESTGMRVDVFTGWEREERTRRTETVSAKLSCRRLVRTGVKATSGERVKMAGTHVGIEVPRHIIKSQMAVGYDVSEKHFEMSLHRS
jgi:hypothetical protein